MPAPRRPLPLLLAVVCGCAAPPPPPPEVVPAPLAPVPTATLTSTAVLEPPAPTPAERLAPLLARLQRSDTPQTLLLGLETASSHGYGQLYDVASPTTPPEDRYRTLVIRYENGRADLAGELPFLAIPQARGFLYLGGASYVRDDTEAEKRRLGVKFIDENGSTVFWYAAWSLWRTTDRAKADATRKSARRALERAQRWGLYQGEDIDYVTSRALCTTRTIAEWTGGALAFSASQTKVLSGLGERVPAALSAHIDAAGIVAFARAILRRREPGAPEPDVSLDKKYDPGWGREVDWRKESRACLAREKGRVQLTGVVSLPNNSARSSEWDVPVREAPADLAPGAASPIDFGDVQRAFAFPKPHDALVSPGKSVLVVQFRDRVVVYGAGAPAPLLSIPRAGRIVMAEWASGEPARAWAQVGDPPAPAPAACACDLGTICVDGACVTPKRIFVTSTLSTGNLGGLAGADARCQARADAGALGGRYKAWLSDSTTPAASRLAHATVPYVLVDGTPVAKDWAGLTSGQLLQPIAMTELGEWPTPTPHPPGCGNLLVWTNTKEDGSVADADGSCHDWTDGTTPPTSGRKGAVWGLADDTSLWSSECKSEYAGCNGSFPLFCVEQ